MKSVFKTDNLDETCSQQNCEQWDSMNHLNLIVEFSSEVKPTVIGENAIVEVRFTIMPGVKLGKYAVVSSGCTIEQDVPDYNMVQMANKVKSIDLRNLLEN